MICGTIDATISGAHEAAAPAVARSRGIWGWTAIIGLAALTACSHWTKPGVADEQQRRLDAYACARDAGLVGVALALPESEALFGQCMTAQGYMKRSD
jgi:hypothetical protein